MLIRKAIKKDKQQLLFLIQQFALYYDQEEIFPKTLMPFIQSKDKEKTLAEFAKKFIEDPQYFTFVAELDGKLVGYICGDIKEKSYRILDKEGFIEDWFVLKEQRRKGVGNALYRALIATFRKETCNRIGVSAYYANSKAIALYHTLGFLDYDLTLVKAIE
ncbi:MAG TPA: GNAT family N-acetyltransferase [Patescibacteria group bacterium]|nr:GNAT family N-acetyltransferase [Patescibacteria group bacterium]